MEKTMKEQAMIRNKDIREFLGHNGSECRVRIKKNKEVWRYGSPVPTNRDSDFWAYMGTVDEIKREIKQTF